MNPAEFDKWAGERLAELNDLGNFFLTATREELIADVVANPTRYWGAYGAANAAKREKLKRLAEQDWDILFTPTGIFYRGRCIYECSLERGPPFLPEEIVRHVRDQQRLSGTGIGDKILLAHHEITRAQIAATLESLVAAGRLRVDSLPSDGADPARMADILYEIPD